MKICLWFALACGVNADDRMVRRYADCMAGPNTVLHRLTVPNAVGAVPLRRGGGGAVARSTGARGGYDGGDQGGPRRLLRIGLDESCGNGVAKVLGPRKAAVILANESGLPAVHILALWRTKDGYR